MKKVLCPIDFSDVSMNTTAYAAKIAQISNAELILFHEHSLWSNPEELVTGSAATTESIASELEERAVQISGAFHISCYADVVSSTKPLSSLIEDHADDIDLIVIGIERETDLIKEVFGSLSFRLIQNVRVPVILVPENYTYQSIDKIVFAFDPYEKSETPIDQLVEWAGCWKSEIQLLEGVDGPDSADSVGGDMAKREYVVIHRINRNELADEIQSFIVKGNVSMLAMFVRDRKMIQRIMHRSLIQKLEAVTTIPLFIFHE
ncbi:MAG: universal stress protein [Cyclobacteriaceae bacterium]